MNSFPYPWTTSLWRDTRAAHDRLPHGLLISGPQGVGKLDFAFALARAELCERSYATKDESTGCGTCRSCELFDAGSHPDFHLIASEDLVEGLSTVRKTSASRHLQERPKSRKIASKLIAIDRVRGLKDSLSTHAFGARKFALIAPADGMNIQAANALLKLLEEPTARTRIVLVTARAYKLPATVRSRVTRVDVAAPSERGCLDWLSTRGVDEPSARKLMRETGAGPTRVLALHQQGFHRLIEELEQSVVSVLAHEKSSADIASIWSKRTKADVETEELILLLRSILNELIRRRQLESKVPDDRLQELVPRLHLQRLHEAALGLSRLGEVWDSVLDTTLVLEQAFGEISSITQ